MSGVGFYGEPPAALIERPQGARQFSPLIPDAADLAEAAAGSVDRIVMLAPPGTLERRYAMALALRVLAPGGTLTALAPKDKGGSRLAKELADFGCAVEQDGRKHYRICDVERPAILTGIDEAIAEGAPRLLEDLGLWSQPGVFSWDRIDPGSALLAAHLPPLSGAGADLGCGIGYLALKALASPAIKTLELIEIDRRAIEAARRNCVDGRARFSWADATQGGEGELDFVVMNPPFHDGGHEDRSLGQAFIRTAARRLRTGGVCWLVANRHLPYEAVMTPLFANVTLKAETKGFKLFEAKK